MISPSIPRRRALQRLLPFVRLLLIHHTGHPIQQVNTECENHLRKVFDDQHYFVKFNGSSSPLSFFSTAPKAGLFMNHELTTPNGLVEFSKSSLLRAKSLVRDMLEEVHTPQGRLSYIRKLDQLSDILCRVIDVAEFIRVSHPSQKWVNAAQQTYEIMFEYMNQLNTNVELYANLKAILDDPSTTKHLTDEEIQVGEYLKQDFERSGIHMDPTTRDNFVAITQQISLLGSHFNNDMHALDSYWCEISHHEFESLSPDLQREVAAVLSTTKLAGYQIPLSGHVPYSLLLRSDNESVRRKVWIALHNSSKDQIHTLNAFLKYRALLSKMLGYESFAQYQLEHKMARTPENVVTFLKNLQTSLIEKQGGVVDEVRKLHALKPDAKQHLLDREVLRAVKPWDRDYLLGKLQHDDHQSSTNILEYLSVGTIVSGLNKLFTSIYNVALVPEPTQKGETWDHNHVRKLKVFDRTANKKLGYLYLDFWLPKVFPSHFTIVCSRKLNTDIGTETHEVMKDLVHLDEEGKAQLPVISLICNFAKPNEGIGRFAGKDSTRPTLLTLDQVDTIFHEMGHAMHSMIGRTDLHNLSGTRCSTDFVELPSVLMELFSKDPRVLCRIAKHYETGEPLSEEVFTNHQSHRVALDQCETFMQLKMAMLDQVLHSEDVVSQLANLDQFDSTAIYHQVESQLQLFADNWSTWHGKFPHLFSYGAVYYSYLLDRAIADKVWKGLFDKNPWSRSAGERYKNSILKWGGTRDPWECLAEALDVDELRAGDLKAMEIIGRL